MSQHVTLCCRPAGAAFRAPPLRAPAALAGPASDALSFGRGRWRRGRCWTRGQRRERGHRARRRGHGNVARTSCIPLAGLAPQKVGFLYGRIFVEVGLASGMCVPNSGETL